MFGRQIAPPNSNNPQGMSNAINNLINNGKKNGNKGTKQPINLNSNSFKPQFQNSLNQLNDFSGQPAYLNNGNFRQNMCDKHNLPFAQYCKADHEPMCQICVGQHVQFHNQYLKTQPILIPMGKALDEVKDKFAEIRNILRTQLINMGNIDVTSHLQDLMKQVITAKKLMIAEVNKTAETLLKNIEIVETNYRNVQFKKPFKQAGDIINKYISELGGVNHIKHVQYAYLFDDQQFMALFRKAKKQNNQELEKSKVQVIYDKVQFSKMIQQSFHLNIPSYGRISEEIQSNERKMKSQDKNIFEKFENNLNKAAEDQNERKNLQIKNWLQTQQIPPPVIQVPSLTPQQKKKNQAKILKIQEEDTTQKPAPPINKLGPNKIIQKLPIKSKKAQSQYAHYFQAGSQNLYLYNLKEGVIDIRSLKSHQMIPFYHKSIQTQDSTLYLSGGKVNTDNIAKRNTNLWSYNIGKDYFKITARNLKPRSSHTIVQHKQYLYIMGGFGEANFERQVQRFDLPDTKTVVYCQPSKFGGQCISASIGDHIWKVNIDGVQLYSPKQDKWAHILPKKYFYNQSCMGAPISDHQYFIFGGYDEGEKGIRNSHILRLAKPFNKVKQIDEDTFVIDTTNKYLLPIAEGFADNTVAITPDCIICWINDTNQQNQVRTDSKSLISFDSYNWAYVPFVKQQINNLRR